MQQRRNPVIIVLFVLLIAIGCLFAASYAYTPEISQKEVVKDIAVSKLVKSSGKAEQPAEYP